MGSCLYLDIILERRKINLKGLLRDITKDYLINDEHTLFDKISRFFNKFCKEKNRRFCMKFWNKFEKFQKGLLVV